MKPLYTPNVFDLSEQAGNFGSDNLVSNELTYQHVIGMLEKTNVTGGAYLGVGPDQNFTYIAHIKPRIAFIIDIRKESLLQHLMYKAFFLMSRNRIEYISILFGRPVPYDTESWRSKSIKELTDYIDDTPLDEIATGEYQDEMLTLIRSFYIQLSETDLEAIGNIYQLFYSKGLEVKFMMDIIPPIVKFPPYRELLLEKDQAGNYKNYLANEEYFHVVKQMQDHNLIIPIIGDFAGSHAIKAIGKYLTEINEYVSAFYVSNVEFYLWQQQSMQGFVANLKLLPITENSMLIRNYVNCTGEGYIPHPHKIDPYYSVQLLQTIKSLIDDYNTNGGYSSYLDMTVKRNLML